MHGLAAAAGVVTALAGLPATPPPSHENGQTGRRGCRGPHGRRRRRRRARRWTYGPGRHAPYHLRDRRAAPVVLGSLRIVTAASDPHLHRWRGMVRLPCSIAHGVTGRNRRRCDARGPDGTGRRSTVASSRCRTGRRSPSVTCGERTPRSYATRTAGCTHDGFRSASALRARAARVRSSILRRSASSSPAAFSAGAGGRSMTTPSPRALRSISASTRS